MVFHTELTVGKSVTTENPENISVFLRALCEPISVPSV